MNKFSYCKKLEDVIYILINYQKKSSSIYYILYQGLISISDLYEHQNLSPGMKLFGVVAEVNEKDLAVSLPGGLRGLVRASEAVEPALADNIKVVVAMFFVAV